MFIASDTDIGKKRSENQDRVHAEFLADNVAVAVVCDGKTYQGKFQKRYETKFHKKSYAHFSALCEYDRVWQEQGGY